MKRIDLKTREEIKTEAVFHSENKINLPATKEKKLQNDMIEEVLENMAKFQRRGSNWRFEEILNWNFILWNLLLLKEILGFLFLKKLKKRKQ